MQNKDASIVAQSMSFYQKNTLVDEQEVHPGTKCVKCGVEPIRGIRYRCFENLDYQLCQLCEASDNYSETHALIKIRKYHLDPYLNKNQQQKVEEISPVE